MYGRELRVIDRWEPTTQKCHGCGFRGGKKADATPRRRKTQGNAHQVELSVREWTCLNCGAVHDRDVNAAVNILVAGGHPETLKRTEPAPPKGARERGARNVRGGRQLYYNCSSNL